MKEIVFLVEEPSMKELLKAILPKVIPDNVSYTIIHHEGKQDLEKSIPKKLCAFRQPETRFVVLIDQDSNDCIVLKKRLLELCQVGGRENCLVRIVCHELESWFLGDLAAVGKAYNQTSLARRQREAKYRQPDRLSNPAQVLKLLVPEYQKISGARAVSNYMKLSENESHSFAVFLKGLQKVIGD
ncbi:DUF4276 family protein [Desulfosporosinus youngiae]|uniref:DUF4276 domain-containing protein n=1 Tax=Desulfosporosinus youngiae DSM 17734 TaxID=768710 RepID=H5Y401_9FIRM|nr:DUF4276 family protein [Desulfosporosinus youngiae]EHQ89539.1 hypothetical protein DesyoDRAFT_2464 [Desulfosporosinus youngiae DSM 17734]